MHTFLDFLLLLQAVILISLKCEELPINCLVPPGTSEVEDFNSLLNFHQ